MDKNNLPVNAKTPSSQTSKGHEYAVKIAGTIVVKVCVWSLCQLRMIKAKFLDKSDCGRVPAWTPPVLTVVYGVGVDSLVDSLFPFQAMDEVKVSFIEVNDLKPVDFEVTFLLEDHQVHDISPTGEIIVVLDSIVDHVLVSRGNPFSEEVLQADGRVELPQVEEGHGVRDVERIVGFDP